MIQEKGLLFDYECIHETMDGINRQLDAVKKLRYTYTVLTDEERSRIDEARTYMDSVLTSLRVRELDLRADIKRRLEERYHDNALRRDTHSNRLVRFGK